MATLGKSRIYRGPIARKVLDLFEHLPEEKVIDLAAFRNLKVAEGDYEKTMLSQESSSQLDPLHAVYVYGQNTLSVLVEQLSELSPLKKLNDAYMASEEEYMPEGPPISPLTRSYFSCWGFFDCSSGPNRESFGTVAIDLCKSLDMDGGLIRILEFMQDSRMGFYIHEGVSGKHVLLRELITDKLIKAIVPSGYLGQVGEMWFARVMPEPFEDGRFGYSVVFTTPYVIGELKHRDTYVWAKEKQWLSFFERNLPKTGLSDNAHAYQFFMKYGPGTTYDKHHPGRTYWNEYIFSAYVNYRQDMILLAGLPDRPPSLPHSSEGQKRLFSQ